MTTVASSQNSTGPTIGIMVISRARNASRAANGTLRISIRMKAKTALANARIAMPET